MMRPHVASRSTWRRANSAMSNALARASTPRLRSMVPAVTGTIVRPKRSTEDGLNVSCTQPVALFTRMSTGPSCSTARSKRPRRGVHVEQVGLEGGTATLPVDGIWRAINAQVRGRPRVPRVPSARERWRRRCRGWRR